MPNQYLAGINCICKVVMDDQLPIWIVVLLTDRATLVKVIVTMTVTVAVAYSVEMTTVLETFNASTIDIVIYTENSPDFWCSYCGLVLRNSDENIVAIENPYNGGSFYGLAGGYSELRTLEIINNIELPFHIF